MLIDEIDIKNNNIISGDNLVWLQLIPDKSIDLCYIDPPFFSNKNYEIVWGNSYETRSFGDRFEGGIKHYKEWMHDRIVLIHQKLKDTGSFYLHCDWHASHYLKIACDEVFGYKNFINEITWNKGFRGTERQKGYQRTHDVILFYAKSEFYTWVQQYQDYQDKNLKRYNKIDEKGNKYALVKRQKTDGSVYYGKTYPKTKGKKINDVIDIPILASTDSERIGYKTQKPESLLRRIILASSNKKDLVLDCFGGGGTTAKVSAQLGRKFICGDVSPVAVRVIASRLNKYCPEVNYNVLGLPKTEKELKVINGHAFAELICRCKGWDVNEKKSDDEGIDGWANNKKVPIQIKNHTQAIGRPDIQKFVGAIKEMPEGIFVAWTFSKKAIEYIASIKANKIIKIVKCEDIFKDILISDNKQKKLEEYYLKRTGGQLELGM